jgi:hypothetical protein
MKHTGKIGHLSSIFMMENGLPAHAGMWDGLAFPMCLKSLIYNHKNTENKVYYTAENLENQEIRINTHTHTHTHTQGLARQDIIKHLIIKGLPGIILSGYPRCPIIIYQKYSVPPCFSEQGGTELLSGGIRSAGFPCPSAAVFFRAAFQQRPRHSLNLK